MSDEGVIDGGAVGSWDAPVELDDFGRKVWESETPVMVRIGRLRETDRAAWQRYCQMLGTWWRYEALIMDEGEFKQVATVAKDGAATQYMTRTHPARKEQKSITSELRLAEDRFGRTPLMRTNFLAKALGGALRNPGSDAPTSESGELPLSEATGGDDPAAYRPTQH